MFRKMLRSRQQLTEADCLSILQKELRGVLSVHGDDGYPYGMPMNHYYCAEDGCLYFHGGRKGHKIDAVLRDNKASFCVYDSGYLEEGKLGLNIRSVIVFGKIEFVEDRETTYEMSRRLSRKFTDDETYIDHEIASSGPGTLMFRLIPDHISGKLVNES